MGIWLPIATVIGSMATQPQNMNSLCRGEQFELYIAFLGRSTTEIWEPPVWEVWLPLAIEMRFHGNEFRKFEFPALRRAV